MDLSIDYMGLTLDSPLVAAASPLTSTVPKLKELEEAGAAGVVLFSLFEEQLQHAPDVLLRRLSADGGSYAETVSHERGHERLKLGPEGYVDFVRKAKEALNIPVIASINACHPPLWSAFPRRLQDAGADAIELNLYFVASQPDESGLQVEQRYLDVLDVVRSATSLPLAVKISPFFSSIPHICAQFADSGAQAVALFNRFYQPDLDIETNRVKTSLHLSDPNELLLRLRWLSILYGRTRCDLAATGGIHHAQDVLKAVKCGAQTTMLCSTLLRHGPKRIGAVRRGVSSWMAAHDVTRLRDLVGSASQMKRADPEAFERAQYLKTLNSWREDFNELETF